MAARVDLPPILPKQTLAEFQSDISTAVQCACGGGGEERGDTDLPAYSDTVYSDTPLTVTLLACPK